MNDQPKRVELRFRHVHLDFHTSEAVEGVAEAFDPDEFADTMAAAHVNSVNVFARCHHGWMYYPSRAFPDRVHPHLSRNLLGEQIEALHRRGILAPVYVTVQWDHYTAEHHPECLAVRADGRSASPYEPGFYRRLCLNSPYADFLRRHVEEILGLFDVDGFWFDIVNVTDCSCRRCRDAMAADGVHLTDPQQRLRWQQAFLVNWRREMSALVHARRPGATIYYNSGDVRPADKAAADAYTHWELESLPSGGWGYLHFPVRVRYTRTLGGDCLGMTGKFHTSWGDFHSFKSPAALQYECFRMLAMAAKCCVGDQLHPSGKVCPHTYDLIGSVYERVEAAEPWCEGAAPVTEVGLMTPEEFAPIDPAGAMPESLKGAVSMLEALAAQFDVIDSSADFGRYRLLVLPDDIPCGEELGRKLGAYLSGGGMLIATYRSCLRPDGSDFALGALGVRRIGDAPYSPDFLVPRGPIGRALPETEHVMYRRGLQVAPGMTAQVLAEVNVPYFNRTWEHFCSHRHTPSSGTAAYPGAVRGHRTIYFAHPLFAQYYDNAPPWCKLLVRNAMEVLLGRPMLTHDGPSTLLACVNEQPKQRRWVVHLLHYIPQRRGQAFDTIEDVIPLRQLKLSLAVPRDVRAVKLAPQDAALEFSLDDGRAVFTVPELRGHQMVVVELA